MNNKHTHLLTGLAFTALGCTYNEAHAEQSTQAMPASVTAFSGASLDNANILDVTSFTTLRAGVAQDLQQTYQPRIRLRGLGSGATSGNSLPYYIPGLERVEILRGPQGTLFGRNGGTDTGFAAFLSAGYNGNRTNDPWNGESSGTISAGLSYQSNVDLGSGKLEYGLAGAVTYYDNALDGWPGDDQYLHDFSAYLAYNQELSQSAELDINLFVNYGDHGSITRGFNWSGPLSYPVIDYNADARLTWRADGLDIADPGLIFRSGLHYGGYDEKESDSADSDVFTFIQELIFLQSGGESGIYLRGEYGQREFDVWDQYDSDRYAATLGIFRPVPCGSQLRLGVGVERLDYDYINLDDRSDITAELLLSGNIGRGTFTAGAEYRTFQNFLNWGGINGLDMRGLQFGARVNHPLNDKMNIRFGLESSHLKSAASDSADGSLSYQRGSIALGYEINELATLEIISALNRTSVDNGSNSKSDTFGTFGVTLRYQF